MNSNDQSPSWKAFALNRRSDLWRYDALMDVTGEWRIYDPQDTRTHPEGIARVEIEFADGRTMEGKYSRDTGLFATVGSLPPSNLTVKRWRYLHKTPDV